MLFVNFKERENNSRHTSTFNQFIGSSTTANYDSTDGHNMTRIGQHHHHHQQPRRSYSSCAEPVHHHQQQQQQQQQHHQQYLSQVHHSQMGGAANMSSSGVSSQRRCVSNRCSPVRHTSTASAMVTNGTVFQSPAPSTLATDPSAPFRQVRDVTRRSRSANCRSKSKSKSPTSAAGTKKKFFFLYFLNYTFLN